MKNKTMIAVGIDVSKGKSTVAVKQAGGEILYPPFDVSHNSHDLAQLVSTLKSMKGDIRVVMEHTGQYWRPVAITLRKAGFRVSVINAMLIHDFGDNSLRRVKTDKADSLKICSYALAYWEELPEFSSDDETRELLKQQSRQYERLTTTSSALKNGLHALEDQVFPGISKAFGTEQKSENGHVKWVDFLLKFWHAGCVSSKSLDAFSDEYRIWCRSKHYAYHRSKAEKIYALAKDAVATLPKSSSTKLLLKQAVASLNAVYEAIKVTKDEMNRLAALLPEYETVMDMKGVGEIVGPTLIAEIGDVRKYHSKNALVAFAGLDAPPYQSGSFDSKSRHVSKRGSPHLRRVLFLVVEILWLNSLKNDPVYRFMDKKRSEGKHYYVCMVAGAAKFLRIYYARVQELLTKPEAPAA